MITHCTTQYPINEVLEWNKNRLSIHILEQGFVKPVRNKVSRSRQVETQSFGRLVQSYYSYSSIYIMISDNKRCHLNYLKREHYFLGSCFSRAILSHAQFGLDIKMK